MIENSKHLKKWEIKKLETELSELYEGEVVKIKHNTQGKFYELHIDGDFVGEIKECSECGYKYDSFCGNWVELLDNCCECGAKAW